MTEQTTSLHNTGFGPARRWPRRSLQIASVAIILLVSHMLWLPFIASILVVTDPLPAQPADAVIPLAGDRVRVWYSAELFRQQHATWFALTNMWIDSTSPPLQYADSVQEQAKTFGVPTDRILVAPEHVASTYAEALRIRQLAHAQEWRSLIIVTSPVHTRRARMILREVFHDSDIQLVVRPVQGHWYTADTWWKYPVARHEIGSEYLKLALYLAGYHKIWKG